MVEIRIRPEGQGYRASVGDATAFGCEREEAIVRLIELYPHLVGIMVKIQVRPEGRRYRASVGEATATGDERDEAIVRLIELYPDLVGVWVSDEDEHEEFIPMRSPADRRPAWH